MCIRDRVDDRAYNKLGFSIHDYFFAKTLDQVRTGGVIAFVTSRYTMDKQSPEVRRYIAQRAELLLSLIHISRWRMKRR